MSGMKTLMQLSLRGARPRKHYSGRATRGVFAGVDKRFGNNVSFSNRKTRRAWKVNAHWKKLYSETLGESIRLHVTTHALKCIDKAGGLDSYLMQSRDHDIGTSGVATREMIFNKIMEDMNIAFEENKVNLMDEVTTSDA